MHNFRPAILAYYDRFCHLNLSRKAQLKPDKMLSVSRPRFKRFNRLSLSKTSTTSRFSAHTLKFDRNTIFYLKPHLPKRIAHFPAMCEIASGLGYICSRQMVVKSE
jgi:hypothetical protein